MRPWVAGLLPLLASCEHDELCKLAGCTYVASLSVAQLSTASELTGTSITFCIRDRCATAELPIPAPMNDVKSVGLLVSSAFSANAYVSTVDPASVSVSILVLGAHDLQDGDLYTATIVGGDGSVVTRASWVANYREYDPNGPECSPHCWEAMLTELPSSGR